ncbi:hypothetical protein EDD18DRAFT_1107517 [Armillaria luteobubalina]|uniref:Uncharacterized protein n=1 Tax=Armillaria luteobubalina TaxID=153913 RepID=A0AA39URB7_9AGAR|nr:hypothetical protein EDD18DRAFT_1107517 [Armillaria luteobubalina]
MNMKDNLQRIMMMSKPQHQENSYSPDQRQSPSYSTDFSASSSLSLMSMLIGKAKKKVTMPAIEFKQVEIRLLQDGVLANAMLKHMNIKERVFLSQGLATITTEERKLDVYLDTAPPTPFTHDVRLDYQALRMAFPMLEIMVVCYNPKDDWEDKRGEEKYPDEVSESGDESLVTSWEDNNEYNLARVSWAIATFFSLYIRSSGYHVDDRLPRVIMYDKFRKVLLPPFHWSDDRMPSPVP